MKVGIMQPYFLPYIGYWQLMNAVDKYVVYDDVNYIKRGWINRNRILVEGQPKYINIPIKDVSQNRLIYETTVGDDKNLIAKNLRMIEHAYKKAPFFGKVYPQVECIFNCNQKSIPMFIMNSFEIIGSYLGIETELILSSNIKKDCSLRGQDKILAICECLHADEYYNAIGGQTLYSREAFEMKGIKLSFLQTGAIEYKQFENEFQSNLSILDVMMFNSREQIRQMLNEFTLVTK